MKNMGKVFSNVRVITVLCAVILSVPIHISYGYAGSAIDLVLNDWHPAEIRGTLMSVHTDPGSIIINEVRILLADTVSENGKVCITRVMNENGDEVGRDALKQGKHVYVKAGTALDPDEETEYAFAKEIYILPRAMSRKEMKDKGIPVGSVTPW